MDILLEVFMEFFLRDVYYVVFSKGYFLKGYFLRYLKYAIDRPGGIQVFILITS